MRDDLRNQIFILLSGVLTIEDAVLFLFKAHTPETVLATEAMIAIDEIGAPRPAEIAEFEIVKIVAACLTVVTPFRTTAPVAVIHTIPGIVDALAVPHVLASIALKAQMGSATIAQVIPGGCFDIRTVILLGFEIGELRIHFFPDPLDDGEAADIHLFEKRFILLFGFLDIEYDVLSVHQIAPAETVLASRAGAQERRIGTVDAITTPKQAVTRSAADTLIAKIALIQIQIVDAVAGVVDPGTVVTFLGAVAGKDKITVAVLARAIAVFAVLHRLLLLERHARNAVAEFKELPEERTGHVELPTKGERIPIIAPPRIDGIHRKRFVGGECGNDLSAGQVALAMIQVTFVTICEPADHPAERTEGRLRYTHLTIELLILRKDPERCRTLATGLLHQ